MINELKDKQKYTLIYEWNCPWLGSISEQLKEKLKIDYKDIVDKIQQEIDKILITQNLQPNKKNVEYIVMMRRWIDLKLIRQNWKRDLLTDIGKCSHSKLIKRDDD